MSAFAFAGPDDFAGILKIMEEDIAPGNFQLLYTRRDDPCASFLAESPEAQVGVIKKVGEVVATIAAIPRLMYVNGRPCRVCYVTNMKRLKDYGDTVNWHEMFDDMCRKVDCDIFYCSLVEGNTEVANMLHKKRKYMPYSETMTGYKTYIFSPHAKVKTAGTESGTEFVRAGQGDEEEIVRFLNLNGKNKNLFPAFDKLSDLGDISADDFYLLKKNGETVAAGALWDRMNVKQYVLMKCAGIYPWLRRLNGIISKLGYITLPEDGAMADFVFISFLLAKDDNEEYYRIFLKDLFKEGGSRSMLVAGTDANNVKYRVLESIRNVSFASEINEIIMTNIDRRTPEQFDRGNIEVECALL